LNSAEVPEFEATSNDYKPEMTKVGIKDIAALTGVSIATVSHAFRNPGRVSDLTREKVLKAAARLGYSPNHLAASLRTARSGNIVTIIPDVTDSYNSRIIKGIERAAHSRGYSVLLGNTQGSAEREKEYAAMARSRQADGIILMSHRFPFDINAAPTAGEELPPIVNGSEFTGHKGIPSVSIDDRQAAIDAVSHLLDLGHRSISVITGDMESTSSQHRLDGVRIALREAGLETHDRNVIHGDYAMSDGERATREILANKEKPTAIFCFSDEIAIGCLHALRSLGLNVPGDLSVVGFDDVPFARYCAPPLTTIAQPAEDIGATCANILLDMIDGKMPTQFRHILPHRLVVRESTRSIA
jgi:LacI family repressor for deo operon, udp, cdd, tsx, nupC, and nupG